MFQVVVVIGFLIAVGAVAGMLARLVTFDRFELSIPRTIALGTVGAAVASVAQWWVLTPAARETDHSTWWVAVLGAVAAMGIYRAWVPVRNTTRTSGNAS
jgi:uncharacterized membrane protein YeaQ/YmgE (transglycosylase-associated protein family)